MSNIEVDSSDEEYYPENMYNRNSCPNKKAFLSSKSLVEANPFGTDSQCSPKKVSKRGSKVKADGTTGKINHGRWTNEEHKKFLEAIEIYGRDWKKVQGYVGTRTSTQARSHAQKVLPHASWVDGVNGSHNSTSTTLTKHSPQSNKNFVNPDFKKSQSVVSDGESSEFAIFKVEKVRKQMVGRDRVNSENNVFSFPVDTVPFSNEPQKSGKNYNRKYSMNVEFLDAKNDLMGSPIKECIKEHISEDEEDEVRDDFLDVPFSKPKNCGLRASDPFSCKPLFWLENKGNELNLDSFDKPWAPEFPMDIDVGLAPWNSLNIMNEGIINNQMDGEMDQDHDLHFSMEVDLDDNYYPITHHFDNNACNLLN